MFNRFKSPLYPALALIILALAFGICGFMIIEGYSLLDAVYMTIITLSTVGFREVRDLDAAGKIFTTVLIITNLGIFTFAISRITGYLLDGNFIKRYREKKMREKISKLHGHVIICGFGRNGSESAQVLRRFGLPFVVIEKNSAITEELRDTGTLFLAEDATRDDALKDAGIDRARALITTLPDDAENVFVVLTARELRKDITIISRATQASSVRKLKTAGATNIIMPDRISGAYMATLVVNPDVMEFIDILSGNIESQGRIEELDPAKTDMLVAGKQLAALGLRQITGINIIGIKKSDGSYVINPDENFVMEKGQRLIVLGTEAQFQRLYGLMK